MTAEASEELGRWTGAFLGERYRVGRQLDRGGMGAVYEGIREADHQRVAIKILHPHLSEDRYHLTRFQREAEAAALLGHRHIVRVVDFRAEPGEPAYLVMEFLDGASLSRVVKEVGPLDVRRVATIGSQCLSALAAAHAAGIVHRDIKPSNIFLAAEGGHEVAKLVDFGIAKMMEGTGYTRMTATGALVGTPAYMPPEQALGKEIDGRADIYSLGVSLFVALTARPPFVAPAFSDLILKILREPPPPLALHRPDVDPAFAAVIDRALGKKPEDRFQSADEMGRALAPWVAVSALPTMMLAATPIPPDTSDEFDIARTSAMPAVQPPGQPLHTLTSAAAPASAPSPTPYPYPATAPAGARVSGSHAPSATRSQSSSAAPAVRPTPAAFEVTATAQKKSSRVRWIAIGGAVVVLGLLLGAIGAMFLAMPGSMTSTPMVATPPAVRPVPTASPTPSTAEPPKQNRPDEVGRTAGPAVVQPAAPSAAPSTRPPGAVTPVRVARARVPEGPSEPQTTGGDVDPGNLTPTSVVHANGVTTTSSEGDGWNSVTVSFSNPEREAENDTGAASPRSSVAAPEARQTRHVDVDAESADPGGLQLPASWLSPITGRLRACVIQLAEPTATMTWNVPVDGSGRPSSASLASAPTHNIGLETCIIRALREVRFPASGRPASYRVRIRVSTR